MTLTWFDPIIQFFSGIAQMSIGVLIGTAIGGIYTYKVVVPKITKNKEIQKITGFFKSEEYKELVGLFREAQTLFKEALPMLHDILENQKNGHSPETKRMHSQSQE